MRLALAIIPNMGLTKQGRSCYDKMITNKEKELLVRGILTNSLNNNIYSGRSNPEPKIIGLFLEFAKEDPEFLAYAIQLHIKYGVIDNLKYFALGALAFSPDKSYFKNIFHQAIENVEDIYNFANILRSKQTIKFGFKLSGLRVDLLRKKFSRLSERELLPYFTLPRKDGHFDLKDLVILLHAKSANPFIQAFISFLFQFNGEIKISKHELPLMWALKEIENESDSSRIIDLINSHDLKWDWVIPRLKIKDPEIWSVMIAKLTPVEVVNRIGSFIRYGCLAVPYVENLILSKIKAGGVEYFQIEDPLRIYLAWRNLASSAPSSFYKEMPSLLNAASYYEFKNLSGNDITVFLDISESMNIKRDRGNEPDSVYRPTIFECAVMHSLFLLNAVSHDKRKLHLYGDEVTALPWTDTLDMMANKIQTKRTECTADVTLPLRTMLSKQINSDQIFIFTNHDYHSELKDLWREYKGKINPDSNLFLIQLTPTVEKPLDLPVGFYRVAEWNDRTAKLIVNTINHYKYGVKNGDI